MPLSQIEQDAIRAEVARFFGDGKFNGLYDTKALEIIEKRAFERCVKSKEDLGFDPKQTLERIEKVMLGDGDRAGRKSFVEAYRNLQRQEGEIKKFEQNPAKIDWEKWTKQVWERIPLSSVGGVDLRKINYGADVERDPTPLPQRTKPIVHSQNFKRNSSFTQEDYHRSIREAIKRIDKGMEANGARLEAALNGESDLSVEQEREWVAQAEESGAAKVAKAVGRGAHSVSQYLGRGMWSKSNAKNDPRFRDYIKKRNAIMAGLLKYLDPQQNTSAHLLDLIDKNLDGIIDENSFKQISAWIASKLKEEAKENAAKIDAYTKQMQNMNEEMLKEMEKHVSEEDMMLRFRILQVFLLISPFAAFSVFGAAFNYISPLSHLISPIFSSGHIAHGIGSIVSSDVFGPIGQLFNLMKLDTAVEWMLDNVPIVNNVCDVFDVVNNAAFSKVFDIVSPLALSPLLPLGIGLGYTAYRLGEKEIPHYYDVRETIENNEKKMEKFSSDFAAAMEKRSPEKVRNLVNEKYKLLHILERAQRFFEAMNAGGDEAEAVMNGCADIKFTFEGKQTTIRDLDAKLKADKRSWDLEIAKELVSQLDLSPADIEKLKGEGKLTSEQESNMKKFKQAAESLFPECDSRLELMKKIALANNFDDSSLNRPGMSNEEKRRACDEIETRAKQREINFILNSFISDSHVPNNKVSNPSAELLSELNRPGQSVSVHS